MRDGDLSYRTRWGIGLQELDKKGFIASYEGNGSVINVMIKIMVCLTRLML